MSHNPYETPNSSVRLNADNRFSFFRSLFNFIIVSIATLMCSWYFAPKINGLFTNLALKAFSFDYWSTRYFFDILNTYLTFFVGGLIAIKLVNSKRFYVPVFVGLIGVGAFFIELGGFDCLGVCGPPLWYDIASFFKHIMGGASAWLAYRVIGVLDTDTTKRSNRKKLEQPHEN